MLRLLREVQVGPVVFQVSLEMLQVVELEGRRQTILELVAVVVATV